MKNKIWILLVLLSVSSCDLIKQQPIPISVQTNKGEEFRGEVNSSLLGASSYKLYSGNIICNGAIPPGNDITKILDVDCSDGRHAEVKIQEASQKSGTGSGKFDDGTQLTFAFGSPMQIANFHISQILDECKQRKINGKLKKWINVSDCSDKEIKKEYVYAGYPYMGLAESVQKKKRAIYEKLDAKKITYAEAEAEIQQATTDANIQITQREQYQRQKQQQDLARCRMGLAATPQPYQQYNSQPGDVGGALSDLGSTGFNAALGMQYIDNCMMAQGWSKS